jgi:hypothetical protein
MKKTKAILIMVVVCIMASVCWGQSYWKRTYGGAEGVSASAITPTPDGNFIVAGGSGHLMKITPLGDTLWTKAYGGIARAIAPTPDGNFIIAGNTSFFSAGSYDVFLLKITPQGDTLWTKAYGVTDDGGSAEAITPTPDGNFIVAGWKYPHGDKDADVYLLKIKPNGDTLWTRTFGGSEWGRASAITSTPDGNFIVAGETYSLGRGKDEVYLLKITEYGDTLWTKTYGNEYIDVSAQAITSTPDGNFIVAGTEILKITSYGDTLWTKTYWGIYYATAYAITPTADGNFIVVGGVESFINVSAWLLKIKPNGDTLGMKIFEYSPGCYFYAITPTSDGNFIATGSQNSNDSSFLRCIIDDRYARKDSLFTFKIPISGDSLSHGYAPLKVPSGMTVSPGGTISWTPKTDSVYMDHVEFLVSDDFGEKDTLTFNIFINSSYNSTAMKPLSHPIANNNHAFSIMQTSSSQIKFTLPSGASNIDIYDIHGRCVQRIKPVGAQAVWNGLGTTGSPVSSGRYFAKIKEGKAIRMGQFTVVR